MRAAAGPGGGMPSWLPMEWRSLRAADADPAATAATAELPERTAAEQRPLLPGGAGVDRPELRQAGGGMPAGHGWTMAQLPQAGMPGGYGWTVAELPQAGMSGRHDRQVAQLPQAGVPGGYARQVAELQAARSQVPDGHGRDTAQLRAASRADVPE